MGKVSSLEEVTKFGRYTILMCALAELMILSQLGNMFYMVYAGAAVTITGCGDEKFSDEMDSKAICDRIKVLQQNETCEPEMSYDFKSFNYEYGYYCSKIVHIKRSISVQMIGVILGSFIFGYISDSYGRKLTMIICLTGCIITGIISAFAHNLITLTAYRLVLGFFNGGQIAALLVFMVENLAKKDRMWVNTIFSWSPNVAVFAVVAYFSGDWRTLSISSSVLAIPALICCIISSESPRWLIQKGRLGDAKRGIQRIVTFNGRHDITPEMIDEVVANEKKVFVGGDQRKRYYIHHVFQNRTLATYAIVLAFNYLAASIINYGLLFNMEKLSGSIYTNNILLGSIRYSICVVSALADYTQKWYGRRLAFIVPMGLTVVGFLIDFGVAVSGYGTSLKALTRAATLLAFTTCNQVYVIGGVISNELFPTPLRSTCFSFLQVISRAGVVIAPQIFLLGTIWAPSPYLVMLLLSFIATFIFASFVPETKGRPLCDRMGTITESDPLNNEVLLEENKLTES